jgi:hypothetical protein
LASIHGRRDDTQNCNVRIWALYGCKYITCHSTESCNSMDFEFENMLFHDNMVCTRILDTDYYVTLWIPVGCTVITCVD